MKKKICLAFGLLISFLPHILGMDVVWRMTGVFISAIWMWITCPIEIGSVVCLASLCLLPGVTPAGVFSSSFGSSTILFLIFSFLLTFALSETGVLRRIAIFFIDNRVAKKNIRLFFGMYLLSILIVGSFMAPTTVFILYFSIVQEIFSLLGLKKGDPLARNMMVGTGFFASISCAMTPIAHTFPLMAIGYLEAETGEMISYITYLKYGVPVCLVLSAAAYGILIIGMKDDYNLRSISFEHKSLEKKELVSVIVFSAVVICWLITGIWPDKLQSLNALGTTWPAMIGCIILAICGCLDIRKGFEKGVSWSAILLCAATLALGSFLTKDDFGVMPAIKSVMEPMLAKTDILLLIVLFAVVMTNLMSNIVTTTVSFNLFVPVLVATGMYSPALATIAIGIGASLAYALPSSIAHIALAGSSGWAESKDMLKYGSIMIVISVAIIYLVMH